MKRKIIICDDDAGAASSLKSKVIDVAGKNECIVDSYSDPHEMIAVNERYDIALIDIELNDENINGFNVISHLRKTNPELIVIVVTAHSKYLDPAMDTRAWRFIEKPVSTERLTRVITSALFRITEKTIVVTAAIGGNREFRGKGQKVNINCKDIVYVTVEARKAKIVTVGNEYIVNERLFEIRKMLPEETFWSCHGSYIINSSHMMGFESENSIGMANADSIPVSRSHYAEVKKKYLSMYGNCV